MGVDIYGKISTSSVIITRPSGWTFTGHGCLYTFMALGSVWSCSISQKFSGDFPDLPITQYLSPWEFPWQFHIHFPQCAPYAGLEAVSGKKWVTWFSTIAPLSLSAWWSYLLPNSLISITTEQGKNHTGMYVEGLFTIHIYHSVQNQTLPTSPSPIESHYFSFVTSIPPTPTLTRTDCAYKIWIL